MANLDESVRAKMEPDKTEKSIRLGCGFAFGLIVGFFWMAEAVMDSWGLPAAIIFVIAIICGVLAMKQGDSFWHSLRSWWFWP